MKKYNDTSVFILAGGKSSRMGKDKGLIAYNEKPMIMHSIEKAKCFCDNIFISSNNQDYGKFGYIVVKDIYTNVGPLGGIHACLSYSTTKYNLFLPCDMPLLDIVFIRNLLDYREKAPVVMPQHQNGKLEPMILLLQKSMLPVIEKTITENKLKIDGILKESRYYLAQIPLQTDINPHYQFLNVNTINDLNYEFIS